MKIQLKTNRGRLPFFVGMLLLSACTETTETDGGLWDAQDRAETSSASPDGGGTDGADSTDGDEDAGCLILDGGCSEGCVPCKGYRYDTELACRHPWEVLVCYDTTGIYPPASPVAQLDPEGNCWILTNPPPELYGDPNSGWTNGGTECLAGLPQPELPYCEE